MAILDLDHVWVTLVSTAESVNAKSVAGTATRTLPGEVRYYVNGRARAFSGVGERTTRPVRLRAVTPETLASLQEWKGETVLYRDSHGHRMYCVYFEVSDDVYRGDENLYDVDITFTEVSYTEGV